MLQNEMGFTFAGRHTSEFGLVWVENKAHTLAPDVSRNEYTIAGKSGTVLLDGETRKPLEFPGSLYLVDNEPENQREAQRKAREILAWLCQGRQRLVFDYEPERFYLAQVDSAITWNLANWFGGEISITLTAQPYAYSSQADRGTAELSKTGSPGREQTEIRVNVHTMHPAPIEIQITNRGTSPINSVAVMDGRIDIDGLQMGQGRTLTISMEEPIDACFEDGSSALPYAQRFDLVTLEAGTQYIPVALGFGGTDHQAGISLAVRGRW